MTPSDLSTPSAPGARDADNERALLGATVAGNYLIEEVIGVGGMGTVYRARQLSLDRPVALKVLHPRCSTDPHYVARFRVEALAASRLEHPNSVRILEFGQQPPLLYLAMEYVRGRTLLEIIECHWPLGQARIVDLLSQVLSALAVAHDLGIVHRDLKPENVLVCETTGDDGLPVEVAKVCDFGIAKLVDRGQPEPAAGEVPPADSAATPTRLGFGRITLAGTVIGTPDYFSPEQARAEPLDARSDLYSLGVVLYYMLAGRLPFEGANPLAVSYMQVAQTPPPPSRWRAVSPALEAICLKAMAKDPGNRFANAREMRAALRSLPEAGGTRRTTRRTPLPARASGIRPGRTTVVGRLPAWARSVRMKVAVVAFAAAGAVTAAVVEPWLTPELQASPGRGAPGETARPSGAQLATATAAGALAPTATPASRALGGSPESATGDAAAKPEGSRKLRRRWSLSNDRDGVLPPSFMLPR